MKRRLVIEPEAEADLQGIYRWYEQQREGLGEECLLAIEAALAEIERRPESFRVLHGEVRRAPVRRFQYGIFFIVEEKSVNVIAILHAKRKPGVWKGRSRKR